MISCYLSELWYNKGMEQTGTSTQPDLSIVLPVYNEAAIIPQLFIRLHTTLNTIGKQYEIIAVDDGSRDSSFIELSKCAKADPRVRVIRFAHNFGQTAALSAGIALANSPIIVTIDSDLENDPADIPRLLAKMDEGYDVVSGWRKGRWQGSYLTRKLPSTIANSLIGSLTGVKLHDYGCTLKAYRSDLVKEIKLYGEMHRFIPAYAGWYGASIAEIQVSHTPRTTGRSNYGFSRTFRVLLDLVLLVFLKKYMNRPMHFFGSWGLASLFLGGITGFAAIVLRVLGLRHFVDTPLPIFSALFLIVGVQFILFGVIAEILMRTYYESQGRTPYIVKEVIASE